MAAVSDLMLALAVQSRNPQLIGAAVGFDLVVDTARFVAQAIEASSATGSEKAVALFLKDRASLLITLVSGPEQAFSQKQLNIAQVLATAMDSIAQGLQNEANIKNELARAESAVREIETQIAGLPVNIPQTRDYMLNKLAVERFVLSILTAEYSGTDCRVGGLLPLP